MELIVENSEKFKKIFDSIKDLDIVETNFEFDNENLTIESMDSTHTSLVFLVLTKDYFKSYRCNSNMNVGLNIPIFCKILKASRDNDEIKISKSKNDNYLSIEISNGDKNQEFELPEMEIETDKLAIEANYSYEVNINSDIFSKLINDIALVEGNNVNIQLLPSDKLMWSSKGDLGKTNLESNIDVIKSNDANGRLENSYSINFLKKFIKSSYLDINGKIAISLDNGLPIKLVSKLNDTSEIKFFIAPKID